MVGQEGIEPCGLPGGRPRDSGRSTTDLQALCNLFYPLALVCVWIFYTNCQNLDMAYIESTEQRHRYNRKPRARYSKMKSLAKTRGIPFEIELSVYETLAMLPCFYCLGKLPETGYGIDRLENSKGYVLGNVVPCCTRCNSMKSDKLSASEMKAMVGVLTLVRGLREPNAS